jgi:hypothetical protein
VAHRLTAVTSALGLGLAAALVARLAGALPAQSTPQRIYTVGQVVAGALQHPKLWDGRRVRVRAIASISLQSVAQGGLQNTQSTPQILLSAVPDARAAPDRLGGMIRVIAEREDGVLTLLRRVPLLNTELQPPQRISTTQAGVYQLRLNLADRDCNFSPCIDAVLYDAAPLPDQSNFVVPGF